MDKSVVIDDYNEDWELIYKQEERAIKELLGDKAISIEHIGSTSIKGLGSKPIIDFMVGVEDITEVEEFIQSLASMGYEHVYHKEFPNRRFFRKGQWRAGTHHLHVYKYGSEEWDNNILFRNYLRTHSDVLENYSQLKKDLAEKYRYDRTAYTNAKHPFIVEVIAKAKNEQRNMDSFQKCHHITSLMNRYDKPWCIAGGWAIDLFLENVTREHSDIEILILREDQIHLQNYLMGIHFKKLKINKLNRGLLMKGLNYPYMKSMQKIRISK